MVNIGITGHQELENKDWVTNEIRRVLKSFADPIHGLTSLAVGADQMFANEVLACGGTLSVIVPFAGYADVFDEHGRACYTSLLSKASAVDVLQEGNTNEEAYYAAGKKVVDRADLMVAIWNGKPAQGLGGTADIVKYAEVVKTPCIHINPVTKTVERINCSED